jgi:hypothetical protein
MRREMLLREQDRGELSRLQVIEPEGLCSGLGHDGPLLG